MDSNIVLIAKRMASIIYDLLVYGSVLIFLCFIVGVITKGKISLAQSYGFLIFLILFQFLIYLCSLCYLSQTVGMTAWKLKIISSNSANSANVSFKQASYRFSIVFFSIGLIWLSIFFNPKESLLEKLSQTKLLIS